MGQPIPDEDYIDASAASAKLAVSRATLYAYVSRGQIRTAPHPKDPRGRLYSVADIETLIRRKTERKPRVAAAHALDWGLPVLTSGISRIADGRLFYRDRDAVLLAERDDLEAVAARLWENGETRFAEASFEVAAMTGWVLPAEAIEGMSATERATLLLARIAPLDTPGGRDELKRARLVLGIAAAAVEGRLKPGVPLHEGLALAWGRPDAVDAIRRALVLTADHELNASTFAVRVTASTGASLTACLIAGLQALSGPRHGGMTARVTALFDEMIGVGDGVVAVRERQRRGDPLPGFGHPLYPDGDPRATALLAAFPPPPILADGIAEAEAATHLKPTLDVALATIERLYGLPRGSGLALFAIGRSVGWIAHATEQQASGLLIRPRADHPDPAAL